MEQKSTTENGLAGKHLASLDKQLDKKGYAILESTKDEHLVDKLKAHLEGGHSNSRES